MPGIVEFPEIVKEAQTSFGHLFQNEPSRQHFGEYLTGLLVAERKTVNSINGEFVNTTDQSCLNRWLTESDWDVNALNDARLAWLQREPSTRYSDQGVIAVDNTLIAHDGKYIEDAGRFWDHADQRYLIAHDYLIANYVCTSGKHYALDFRRFRKEVDCAATGTPFKDHTVLFCELVNWLVEKKVPGDFTFDCYFTNATILNHLQGLDRGYVGDLKFNRKIWTRGIEMSASDLAASITPEDRKPVDIGDKRQWYFTRTIRIPNVGHPVRIVILWKKQDDKEAVKMLVTNRIRWEVTRILRVYRRRWTGTETFHRDGKQHLGMGDCQIRNGEGQTRHMYLVILAHSLLVSRMRQGSSHEKATVIASTIGEACRKILRESLGRTIAWAIDRAVNHRWSHEHICVALKLT